MTGLPASAYWASSARKVPEGQVIVEQVRSVIAELPGGGVETTLTIAAGVITPVRDAARIFSIEGEGGVADDLVNIDVTQVPDGAEFLLRAANAGHVITVKHAGGGVGAQFSLAGGVSCVLDATTKWLWCKRTGSVIEEVTRLNFGGFTRRVIIATGAVTLTEQDSGALVITFGAAADVVASLPPAAAGLEFDLLTNAAFKLKALCAAGDKIREGITDGSATGNYESDNTAGRSCTLTAIDTTRWMVRNKVGTWTLT